MPKKFCSNKGGCEWKVAAAFATTSQWVQSHSEQRKYPKTAIFRGSTLSYWNMSHDRHTSAISMFSILKRSFLTYAILDNEILYWITGSPLAMELIILQK